MYGPTDRQTDRIHIHQVYVGLAQACPNYRVEMNSVVSSLFFQVIITCMSIRITWKERHLPEINSVANNYFCVPTF